MRVYANSKQTMTRNQNIGEKDFIFVLLSVKHDNCRFDSICFVLFVVCVREGGGCCVFVCVFFTLPIAVNHVGKAGNSVAEF